MRIEYCHVYCYDTDQQKTFNKDLNDPENPYLNDIKKGIGDVTPITLIYDEETFVFPDFLIIEDEIGYISDLLNSFENDINFFDLTSITTIGIVLDSDTLAKVLKAPISSAPTLITLDFNIGGRIELSSMKQAEKNYDLIKIKFPNVPVIGITNFSESAFAAVFIEKMRKNYDNVWQKSMIYGVLSSLILDRLTIKKLEEELLEKDSEIVALHDKKEQTFFNNYFEGDPININDVRAIEIEGLTPAEIMAKYDLASGKSLAICSMFYEIEGMLKGADTICILGEEGTGKNIIPQIIHDLSGRPSDKYVKVECDTLGEDVTVITSMLFGVENAKYTGVEERKGEFEKAAPNGTIFLDEIHHLPLKVQATLLNFIQDKSFKNSKGKEIDISGVRIIIGSNQDLHQMTLKDPKEFHSDLLSRISNILRVPNLNDRDKTCIKAIVLNSLKKINSDKGKSKTLSSKALAEFYNINYSDVNLLAKNVREIERRLKKAVRRCREQVISEKWIASQKEDVSHSFDNKTLNQHLKRLQKWIPALNKINKDVIKQIELATELGIEQAMISQDLGSANDNENKINEIIRQKLLSQEDVEILLKLRSFNKKFLTLCKEKYTKVMG